MSEYFSHDYNARNDLNMKKLFMGEGLSGIGLYWCLVEMLYEKNGYIDLEYIPIIAFDLRTTEETVHRVIDKYELFCKNDTHFFSNSVLKRLEMRNEKSEKAKSSANARWNNANAMRTHSESNAIKENKIKEKEIIYKEEYLSLFSLWNEQKISVHRDYKNEKFVKAYEKASKKYTYEQIKTAIERYGIIYHSKYFFDYKWYFDEFLTQKNCIPTLLDNGNKWVNYNEWLEKNKQTSQPKVDGSGYKIL